MKPLPRVRRKHQQAAARYSDTNSSNARVILINGDLMTSLTLLVKGLLKNRLVKAAEGGTEIFKFREQELLIPVGHVVLGLRRLLEAHRLGHRLWVVGHLDKLGEKKNNL